MVKFFILPPAQKFWLVYDGETEKSKTGKPKYYIISAPIEMTEEDFTAYAFKKGVRTFKFAKILKLGSLRA
jgi:hypothetical protein